MTIEKRMSDIINKYFISRKQFNLLSFTSGEIDYTNPYYVYYRNVEIAFSKLNNEEKMIINNDYFLNDYYGWWTTFFNKETYEKNKKQAVKKFLRFLYEIR